MTKDIRRQFFEGSEEAEGEICLWLNNLVKDAKKRLKLSPAQICVALLLKALQELAKIEFGNKK